MTPALKRRLALAVALALVAALIWSRVRPSLAIDDCLDRGGRWDDDKAACVLSRAP